MYYLCTIKTDKEMKKIIILIALIIVCVGVSAQTRYKMKFTEPNGVNPMLVCTNMDFGGYKIDVMFDTGSTCTQLPYSDYVALKRRKVIGEHNLVGYVKTCIANGTVTAQKPKYKIKSVVIGGIKVSNIEVVFDISNKSNTHRLIGQNFLRYFDKVEFDFNNKEIVLIK